MIIRFSVPGNPKALKRHRMFRRGNALIAVDPSKADKADFLAMAMESAPAQPLEGPIRLSVKCFFQRPKSHYRTGRNSNMLKETAPYFHTSTPDLDNIVKFVGDSLNHIFWRDDSLICKVEIMKVYSEKPRVEVEIETL